MPMRTVALLALFAGTAVGVPQSRVIGTLGSADESFAELQINVKSHAFARRLLVQRSPKNLREYCSGGGGDSGGVQEGMEVEANWEGYGTMYPGKVTDVNKDGTYDIEYDDGFSEKRVKAKRVEAEEFIQVDSPKDDPLCEMQEFVDTIKTSVDDAFNKIGDWLGGQKAKEVGDKAATIESKADDRKRARDAAASRVAEAEASANATAAAPATADSAAKGNKVQSEELERLKQELTDLDEEIKDLEADFVENDKELHPEEYENSGKVKTIDDLIAEYKARIIKRHEKIAKLKAKLNEQEEELAASAAGPVTLADIQLLVEKISAKCDEARLKRAALEKAGKLDPELDHSLEDILKAEEKLKAQVAKLVEMDKKAKARKEMAEKSKGTKAGTDDAKAAEEADREVIEAAQKVEAELRDVKDSTKNLDEGVIPHGEKWWRYRYEHSYVEGILMIIVSFLMLLWERLYYTLRTLIYSRTDVNDNDLETQGTMFIRWFEFLAGELMVSLFVFLTVWVLSQVGAWDYLAVILKSSDGLHLPHSGQEYRRMALDICVVLFVAIIFYFFLMSSVVVATTRKLNDWKLSATILGTDTGDAEDESDSSEPQNAEEWNAMMDNRWYVKTKLSEYEKMQQYWELNKTLVQDYQMKMEGTDAHYSARHHAPAFWRYLRYSVRQTNDVLFRFGIFVWTGMILTFALLCVAHRVAHLGYIRIMCFVGLINVLFFVFMGYIVWKVNNTLSDAEMKGETQRVASSTWNIREKHICALLHFFQFLLCYGASRMFCQPWMWELHFFPVLCLTILTIILSIVFILFVAPLFPKFAAASALPPFLDEDNIKTLSLLCADQELEDEHKKGNMSVAALAKRRASLMMKNTSLKGKQGHV